MQDQNAAVKASACMWTGEGDGGRRTAQCGGVALGGPIGDCSGWQRRGGLLQRYQRQAQRVCTWTFGSRSSSGKL